MRQDDIWQRPGRFRIRNIDDRNAADVMRIMGKCIVVRAETHDYGNHNEYVAYSRHFEIVPEACMPPEYEWVYDGRDWTPRRTDNYSAIDVGKMVSSAIEKAMTQPVQRIVYRESRRGWKR